MRIIKSSFIVFLLLLLCSVGVFADNEAPQYYVGENNQVGTIPQGRLQQIGNKEEGQESSLVDELEFGAAPGTGTAQNPENWYWIGQSTDEVSNISLKNTGDNASVTGYINIVVGPNAPSGTIPAVTGTIENSSSWELNSGQTINIFQAASSNNPAQNEVTIGNCIFVLYNNLAEAKNKDDDQTDVTPTSALTINKGGTLNVYSGVFVPTAGNTSGLSINGGTAQVFSAAQLQPTCNVDQNLPDSPQGTIFGLSLSNNGTLVNKGYLPVLQNFLKSDNTQAWDYAAIDGTGLTVDGGTVQTSSQYPQPNPSTNGVWIQSSGNSSEGGSNPISASTNKITTFGNATLYTGFINGINLTGSNSLTVNSDAELIIPNTYTLNFGSGSASNDDGELIIDNNGTLNISENAEVNMKKGSTLTNNGNIIVNSSENNETTTNS